MSTLLSRLNDLTENFASGVIDALRGMSLQDLQSASGGRAVRNGRRASKVTSSPRPATPKPPARGAARLPRRSAEDIATTLDGVVALVKKNPNGLRAEQIRKELGLQSKEMPRVLKEGLAKKALKTKGQRRAMTYFAR